MSSKASSSKYNKVNSELVQNQAGGAALRVTYLLDEEGAGGRAASVGRIAPSLHGLAAPTRCSRSSTRPTPPRCSTACHRQPGRRPRKQRVDATVAILRRFQAEPGPSSRTSSHRDRAAPPRSATQKATSPASSTIVRDARQGVRPGHHPPAEARPIAPSIPGRAGSSSPSPTPSSASPTCGRRRAASFDCSGLVPRRLRLAHPSGTRVVLIWPAASTSAATSWSRATSSSTRVRRCTTSPSYIGGGKVIHAPTFGDHVKIRRST